MLYILITGTRDVRDRVKAEQLIRSLLLEKIAEEEGPAYVKGIHGDAVGIDTLFAEICDDLGIEAEPWPARLFYSPLARNEFMVKLAKGLEDEGHTVEVWALARSWKSGTGHCARKARQYGLRVVDYGVSTQ
jgi:hypothetical protein